MTKEREEAIAFFKDMNECTYGNVEHIQMAIKALEQEPKTDSWSIKDVADTFKKHGLIREQEPCEDAISRQAVLDILKREGRKWGNDYRDWVDAIKEIKNLSPVNPTKTGWIPMTTRPMTEEETEHYFEYTDMRIDDAYTIFDCPLPDDGQEVFISCGGYVMADTFYRDDGDGCYFEGVDIDEVDAWMPLPKPYEPQESEDKDADKKCTYKETGCGSCKRQLDCPIEADTAERTDT